MCYMYNIHLSVILWNEIEKQKQNPTPTKNKPRKPQKNQDYLCNGKTKKKKNITIYRVGHTWQAITK